MWFSKKVAHLKIWNERVFINFNPCHKKCLSSRMLFFTTRYTPMCMAKLELRPTHIVIQTHELRPHFGIYVLCKYLGKVQNFSQQLVNLKRTSLGRISFSKNFFEFSPKVVKKVSMAIHRKGSNLSKLSSKLF